MTLATFITDVLNTSTAIVSLANDVLDLFMQPPLVFFVGMAIFGTIFAMVRKLLLRRRV